MRKTLDEALKAVFHVSLQEMIQTGTGHTQSAVVFSKNAKEALQHYNKALHFLEQKDWIGFGKEMQKVQSILSEMAKKNELQSGALQD